VGQKTTVFSKCVTPIYVDIEKRSMYQTVQFSIWSKTGVLHFTAFRYSLHNFSVSALF